MKKSTDGQEWEWVLLESDQVEVGRNTQLVDQIVFVDGLSGTGKTMMGPILSSFDRMEVQRFDHIHEYICGLSYLGRMEEDAAVSLIRIYVDLACYNVMIGRETNFRWKDLSGVLSNPRGWRYLKRLFQPDGDAVMDRIKQTRPILQIHSHQLLGISERLFTALGKRLTLVEMVRHPLYLLSHWYSCIDRLAVDPRVFMLSINHDGATIPWFTKGWEAEFVASNKMDRVIRLIYRLSQQVHETLDAMDEETRQQVMMIPFERFVVDPWPYLHDFEGRLDTAATSSTTKAMRKQKVPRKLTTDGRDLAIYRRYNWESPPKDGNEGDELQKRWDFAAAEATKEGLDLLEKMGAEYQERYLQVPVS
jgi:hypothetical protein